MLQTLRNRDFRQLWLAQLVSGTGDTLYQVGVMVTIFEITGSALQTMAVTVATMLPPFVLGPFAGAVVDQYPRRAVMILMDVLRAGLVGLLLLLVRGDSFPIWAIYLVVAGLASATAFYQPARQSIIPALVPRDQLVTANSLLLSTTQVALALGYILGGTLILLLTFEQFVIIDLITFLVAGGLVWSIQRQERPVTTASERPHLWRVIGDGWHYLRGHAIARPLVVMELLEHVPHGIWTSALMLVFVREALNGTPSDWGYQNGAFFAGQIVGAAVAGLAAQRLGRRAGWVIVVNAFLSGLFTLIYAAAPDNLTAMVLAFAFGPPMAVRDVAQDSLLQMSVEEQMLGRVFAMRNMFWSVVFMAAGLFFAWLADRLFIRWIYVIGGILYLGTAVYAVSNRALRQARMGDTGTSS